MALQEGFGPKPDPAVAEPIFDALDPAVRNTWEGERFAERLRVMREIAGGNMAPEFTLNDVNGKPVILSDYRGKYLLLDFMGSWCQSCRREIPHVIEVYGKYKDCNIAFLSVFIEQRKQVDLWLKAIEKDGIPWTCVVDWQLEMPVTTLYGILGVPCMMIIGPDGQIVNPDVKGPVLEAALEALFGAK